MVIKHKCEVYLGDDCDTCLTGWTGFECTVPTCFGVAATNATVCSGHGKCLNVNVCECELERQGQNCEIRYFMDGNFTQLSSTPSPYAGQLATQLVAFENKLYAFGGCASYVWVAPNMMIYDTTNNTWNVGAASHQIYYHSMVVVGDLIYVFGGVKDSSWTAQSTLKVYSPKNNTWITKASGLFGRFAHSATVVDTKMYVFGGLKVNPSTYANTLHMYDTVLDKWTEIAANNIGPTKKEMFSMLTIGRELFITSGSQNPELWAYNVDSNFWRKCIDYPYSVDGGFQFTRGSILFSFLGSYGSLYTSPQVGTILEYDTKNNVWYTRQLNNAVLIPSNRVRGGTASIGNKYYFFGGQWSSTNYRELWSLE